MVGKLISKQAVLAGIIFLLSLFLLSPVFANAQTAPTSGPQFLITWQATNSYAPTFYQGKVLPGPGSSVTISMDLISQGKILNIKNQTIQWYLGDTLIGNATGLQHITFPVGNQAPNTLDLRVELPSYNGSILVQEIAIPVAAPLVVLYAPFPNEQFSENPLTLEAFPYFFNATSATPLVFSWNVNGQTAQNGEDPDTAEIILPSGATAGSSIDVSITIQNSIDSTVAVASKNLTYEPQP